jgi:hypothetical protein
MAGWLSNSRRDARGVEAETEIRHDRDHTPSTAAKRSSSPSAEAPMKVMTPARTASMTPTTAGW